MRGENFRAESKRAKAGLRLGQLDGIDIQAEQFSSRLKARENFLGVSAVAERAVDCDFAGLGRKDFQDLRHHDRPVRAGGRLAGGDDFGDGFRITLRIVLLVLLLETARVFAGITADGAWCGAWG